MADPIITAADLEALPDNSVILDQYNDLGIVHLGAVRYPETASCTFEWVAKKYLPAVVVYRPDTPPTQDAHRPVAVGDIADALDGTINRLDCDDCPETIARIADEWRADRGRIIATDSPPTDPAPTVEDYVRSTAASVGLDADDAAEHWRQAVEPTDPAQESCCEHSVMWHHDSRGCGYHGFTDEGRCPCLLTSDEALAAHDAQVRADTAERIAEAIRALPTTRTQAFDRGWSSVALNDALDIAARVGRGEGG